MIRTQVYLPDLLHQEAKQYAKLSDQNISELMREGLSLVLHKKKKTLKKKNNLDKLVGKYRCDTEQNIATSHNDIYDL